jgi:hypothetical protein
MHRRHRLQHVRGRSGRRRDVARTVDVAVRRNDHLALRRDFHALQGDGAAPELDLAQVHPRRCSGNDHRLAVVRCVADQGDPDPVRAWHQPLDAEGALRRGNGARHAGVAAIEHFDCREGQRAAGVGVPDHAPDLAGSRGRLARPAGLCLQRCADAQRNQQESNG